MRFFFMLLVCLPSTLSAQYLSGRVTDAVTSAPISYAIVSLPNLTKGVYTANDGSFRINAAATDTLVVSSLGYQPQTIVIPTSDPLTIRLLPVSYELNAINVTKRRSKARKKKVGKVKGVSRFGIFTDKGSTLARYLENEEGESGYLGKLHFRLQARSVSNCPGLARVRIFAAKMVEDTIQPGRDLLLESPVISLGPKITQYKVDATDWEIELPEAGLFVGLELLGESPACPNYDPKGFGKSLTVDFSVKAAKTWIRIYNGGWHRFQQMKNNRRDNINVLIGAEYRVFKR